MPDVDYGMVPENVLKAYHTGTMTPENVYQFETDVKEGRAQIPDWFELKNYQLLGPQGEVLSENIYDTVYDKDLEQEARGIIERGEFKAPMGFPEESTLDTLKKLPGQALEMVTGAERAVESTEALQDVNLMPEMASLTGPAGIVGFSTAFTGNQETAQIFKANFPDNPTRQDEKGNWIFTSLVDNKDYALKPGFGPYDTGRVVAGLGVGRVISLVSPIVTAVLGEGALATTAGAALTETLAEAINQGVQKGAGGEFDTADLALAGAIPVVGGALKQGYKQMKGVKPPVVKPHVDVKPDIPTAQVIDEIDIVSTKSAGKETISAKSEYGNVTGQIKGDGLHITESIVDEAERGQGKGVKLYTEIVDDAHLKGQKVFSDETVTEGAVRIYDSLKRRGYEVIKNEGGVLDDGTMWAKGEGVPVFEVKPKSPTTGPKKAETGIFTEAEQVELGKVMRKAQGGNKKAQARLMEMSRYNEEAAQFADDLAMDLPIDVLSDSFQVKAGVGLARSKAGKELEAQWDKTLIDASNRTDELLEEAGVLLHGDGPSISGVSDKILLSLDTQSKDLHKQAKPIYESIESKVPLASRFDIANTKEALNELLEGVDLKVATKEERELFDIISSNDTVGYGTVKRIKGDLFSSQKGKGKYKNANERVTTALYDAIKKDELENVAKIGGKESSEKLTVATELWKQKKTIDDRIVKAFGKNADGAIGKRLVNMLTDAANGGGKDFKVIMDTIMTLPKGERSEVLITAIAKASRATKGKLKDNRSFGFTQYSNLYGGLRENPSVFGAISKELGKEKSEMLRKLYSLSKRISQSQSLVIPTGKASQTSFVDVLGADGLVASVLDSTVGKVATTIAGAKMGGPVGAGVAAGIVSMIKKGGVKKVEAAGKLFDDPDFKNLAVSTLRSKEPKTKLVKKVAQSNVFKAFAREVDLSPTIDAETWLLTAIRSGRQYKEDKKENK